MDHAVPEQTSSVRQVLVTQLTSHFIKILTLF
jgi:hypothetical protein